MTIYEFIALNEIRQQEAVNEGVYIGDRKDYEHTILLYQVDTFYVEVYYLKKKHKLKRFVPFTTMDLLEPYLDQIELPWWIK
jgi:hypothetical protein